MEYYYIRKTWNPLLEVWRDEPKKNQWSHGADTIRYMVQACTVHIFDEDYEEVRASDSISI